MGNDAMLWQVCHEILCSQGGVAEWCMPIFVILNHKTVCNYMLQWPIMKWSQVPYWHIWSPKKT